MGRIISRNISERLPAEKVKEAEEFYRPYFKLNPCFHEFYAGKTGKFDVRYFPDDMWYGVVNNYFNDKKMAAVLDNKCFYPRIFGDICKQARNIAYRMNGYWFSPELVLISENTLMGG